ncbi:MAG: hypothetical protein AAFV53_40745 [Myxococcota bacterium]
MSMYDMGGGPGGAAGGGGASAIPLTLAESFDFTVQGTHDLVATPSKSLTGAVGGAGSTTLSGTSLSGTMGFGPSGLVMANMGGALHFPLGDIIDTSDYGTIVVFVVRASSVTKDGTGGGVTRIGYSRTSGTMRAGHFVGWAESTARNVYGGCKNTNGGSLYNIDSATGLSTDPDVQMVVVRPALYNSRAYYIETAASLPDPSSDEWIQYTNVQNGGQESEVDVSPVLQAVDDFFFVEFFSTPAGLTLTDLAVYVGQTPTIFAS